MRHVFQSNFSWHKVIYTKLLTHSGLPSGYTPPFPPASTPTPIPTATVTPAPLPECTILKNIYTTPTTPFDPSTSSDTRFFTYLLDPNTPSDMRRACWQLYEDIIFLTAYHELLSDQFLSWNEFGELDNATFAPALIGDSRDILPIETNPFTSVTWNSQWNHRYLFARTIINGMSNSILHLNLNTDPMRYFAKNYSETVSSNWMGVEPFCAGTALTILPADSGLPPSCMLRDWYSTTAVQGYKNTDTYNLYISIIRQAISDEVLGITDPTNNAFGARPANRIWRQVAADNNLGPNSIANHPVFIFQTYLGSIVRLQWGTITSSHGSEWYPSGIWSNNNFVPVETMTNCLNINETLPQSYMRHLRELFNNTAQTALFNGTGRNFYGENDLRWGSGGLTGLHAHAVVAEGTTNINYLRWYTFVFTHPTRTGETVGSSPIWGSEYIVNSNNVLVATAPNGTVLQPFVCP